MSADVLLARSDHLSILFALHSSWTLCVPVSRDDHSHHVLCMLVCVGINPSINFIFNFSAFSFIVD